MHVHSVPPLKVPSPRSSSEILPLGFLLTPSTPGKACLRKLHLLFLLFRTDKRLLSYAGSTECRKWIARQPKVSYDCYFYPKMLPIGVKKVPNGRWKTMISGSLRSDTPLLYWPFKVVRPRPHPVFSSSTSPRSAMPPVNRRAHITQARRRAGKRNVEDTYPCARRRLRYLRPEKGGALGWRQTYRISGMWHLSERKRETDS